MCLLLFDKLVELRNVHQDGGDRYQVDGNPRFRLWCQPARSSEAGKYVDLARAVGRQSRKPVNQAQGVRGIEVRAKIWPKIAGIAVNLLAAETATNPTRKRGTERTPSLARWVSGLADWKTKRRVAVVARRV